MVDARRAARFAAGQLVETDHHLRRWPGWFGAVHDEHRAIRLVQHRFRDAPREQSMQRAELSASDHDQIGRDALRNVTHHVPDLSTLRVDATDGGPK